MFLSIIIPTWRNTEEEIRRCLDSIDQSAWRDFEVLLVDDGNEAAYATMLDGLAETYPMLRVFHLSHGGVSAARNFGMAKAAGEYILFVDADDIVTKQFWHDVAEIAEKGCEADVIYGMVHNEVELAPFVDSLCDGMDFWVLNAQEKRALYAHFFALQRSELFSTKDGHVGRGPWARILRREMAIRYPFLDYLFMGQDMIWNLDILKGNPKVAVTHHVWYCVMGNPDSTTRGYWVDLVERKRNLLRILAKYNDSDTEEDYRYCIFEALSDIGKRYYLSPKNPMPWFRKVKEFNQVAWGEPFRAVLQCSRKACGLKWALKIFLYRSGFLLYAYRLKMVLQRDRKSSFSGREEA